MKKLVILLVLVFIGFSCDLDNEKPITFDLELVSIESVRLPEFFVEDETYEIEMQYLRPSVCHFPNAVSYSQENEEITRKGGIIPSNKTTVTVSVENIVFKGDNCDTEIPEDERVKKAILKLKIDQPAGTIYLFRFLKEIDSNGDSIYFVERRSIVSKNDSIVPRK